MHNLMLLLSQRLESEEGIQDVKVERKYSEGLKARKQEAARKGRKVSPWVETLRRITRWSSQYVRWLSDALLHDWSWASAVKKLRPLMLEYMR